MTINPEAQALDDLFPDGELVEPSYSDVDRRSEGSPDEKVIAQLAEAAAEVSDESEAAAVMTALSQTPGISESKIAPDVLAKLLPDSEVVVLPQVERVAGGIGYRAVKRVFDVVSCSLALVILAIPMGVIALKIRRESTGPAVYAQRRVGMNGEVFELYKFRSMYLDAEVSGAQWAEEGDPRVTPLGRKLRRSRLASVIIGTPGDGESTKSLSRSANSSLDLQLCECRPGLCSTCNSHYKPFEFLSLGIFGGVPSLSRNLVGCNGFSPSEESAIRFSFLGFGKDGACAAW